MAGFNDLPFFLAQDSASQQELGNSKHWLSFLFKNKNMTGLSVELVQAIKLALL